MLNYCKGIPILIKVLGGSPYTQKIQFEDLEQMSIPQSRQLTVLELLQPSFSALEPHLQECFADMGSFLEDQKISASVIADIWAELYTISGIMCIKYLEELAFQNLLKLGPIGYVVFISTFLSLRLLTGTYLFDLSAEMSTLTVSTMSLLSLNMIP